MIRKTFSTTIIAGTLVAASCALLGGCASTKELVEVDCSVLEGSKRKVCETVVEQVRKARNEKTEEKLSESSDVVEAE